MSDEPTKIVDQISSLATRVIELVSDGDALIRMVRHGDVTLLEEAIAAARPVLPACGTWCEWQGRVGPPLDGFGLVLQRLPGRDGDTIGIVLMLAIAGDGEYKFMVIEEDTSRMSVVCVPVTPLEAAQEFSVPVIVAALATAVASQVIGREKGNAKMRRRAERLRLAVGALRGGKAAEAALREAAKMVPDGEENGP